MLCISVCGGVPWGTHCIGESSWNSMMNDEESCTGWIGISLSRLLAEKEGVRDEERVRAELGALGVVGVETTCDISSIVMLRRERKNE